MSNGLPTPIGSTKVAQALANDLSINGKWNQITFADDLVIKMKKLTGTTDADTATSIAHGLTASKILSVSCIVTAGGSFIPPNFDAIANPNYYTLFFTSTNIQLSNVQTNVQNVAYKVLITYEE